MAKDQGKFEPPPITGSVTNNDVPRLAEQLFVKSWQPGGSIGGKDPVAFAAMCFQGAMCFLKVASRIREGEKPDAIITPVDLPDNVTITQ